MNEYLVRSAKMSEIVKAKNVIQAAKKAIMKGKPKRLGQLIQIDLLNQGNAEYVKSKSIVKVTLKSSNDIIKRTEGLNSDTSW